jgi:hypothetical protein
MAATATDRVYEENGRLWKPKADAVSTFDELLAAQATFLGIHKDARWNPWVEEDRVGELERAMAVMRQWTRAEPGFRQMTKEELEVDLAKSDEEFEARYAADEARWERDRARYDPAREAARLSLLEQQAGLEQARQELAQHMSGKLFPAMPADRRAVAMAELEAQIAKCEATVAQLREQVGDPEDVVDELGHLPRDRRETSLLYYDLDRRQKVKDLRMRVPEFRTALKRSTERAEKSKLRMDLQLADRDLDALLAVPPLWADDMCSECATPASQHGYGPFPQQRPCPAWPGWAARLRQALRILEEASARSGEQPLEPGLPKPQPLAVVPSGLPIEEAARRLEQLEAEHPGAIVKRGRGNRWEIWPEG